MDIRRLRPITSLQFETDCLPYREQRYVVFPNLGAAEIDGLSVFRMYVSGAVAGTQIFDSTNHRDVVSRQRDAVTAPGGSATLELRLAKGGVPRISRLSSDDPTRRANNARSSSMVVQLVTKVKPIIDRA